jgi:hypothetical protein
MKFVGRAFKAGRFWAIEIPILNIVTQGKSLPDALAMIADAVEALVNRPGFAVNVFAGPGGDFEIGSSDEGALTALLLRRARACSGLSLDQVAARLGEKSVNGYARYEQGRSVPSIKKLSRLYAAVGRTGDFVLDESRAGAGRDIIRRRFPLK